MQCLEIRTTGEPIAQKARRISGKVLESVRTEYAELLNLGMIRLSTSPWASPLVVVKKRDGTFRACGDYRILNSVPIPDKYPLPRISDILDRILSSSIFSTIDLKKAYHQIPIHESDIPKTACITETSISTITLDEPITAQANDATLRVKSSLVHNILMV